MEQNGIQYLAALSYAAIERADLSRKQKRDRIASVYALIGLIDEKTMRWLLLSER